MRNTRTLETVRATTLTHYRMCHHIGRYTAGYSPVVAPLPEKFLLVEIVNLFMRHAQRLAERLWELGMDQPSTAGCQEALWDLFARQVADGQWQTPLAELSMLATELPDIYESIAENFGDSAERRPDRELFLGMARELRQLLEHDDISDTIKRQERPRVRLYDLAQSGSSTTGGPVPVLTVRDRVYAPGVTTTREAVQPKFKPTNRDELAFFVHNQLQIEFVAIDIAMRNIADFGDLPLSFYIDQTRHAQDEVRHTQMLLHELAKLDTDLTDHPFEIPDRFSTMIHLGLAERLVILSRTGESEAIEAVQIVLPHLEEQGWDSVAEMMENVLYDETRHAWYGNKWLRWLAGNDDERVNEVTAHSLRDYNEAVEDLGARMSVRDPDYLESVANRERGIDPELRAHAGFTDKEVALMQGMRNWAV